MIAENRAGHPGIFGKTGPKAKAAVAAALILLVAAGAVLGQRIYAGYRHAKEISETIDTDSFYPGIKVQGIDLGGKSMSEAKTAVEAVLPAAQPVELQITDGSRSWELTEKDLSFQYNTDEILKEAYSYARSGDREQRLQLVRGLEASPKTYSIAAKIDGTSLRTALDKIADQAESAPKGPSVTSFNTGTKQFSFADGTDGVTVDREKLLADAQAVISSGGTGTVRLSTGTTPFSGTLADLKPHMKKLGSFSTVSKNSADGTYNMTKALLSANGVCVQPGAAFSFFGTAGQCGQAQGYRPAGAILNGKLIQEYGGGICQASTTIYGAAVRSGMKITERHNHSMPSSYCPIGQDATVSYPGLDFKFVNPTKYPVYLVTSVKNRVLTVTFYGYQPDDYDAIDVSSKVTETIPAPAKGQYVPDSSLKKGEVKLTSKARTGYKATAQRIFRKNGTVVKTEELPSSYYKPQPAYYSYGEGTDLAGTAKPSSKAAASPSSSKPASSAPPSSKPSSAPASSAPASSTPGAGAAVPNDDITTQGEPAA
ncbi:MULTISPECIES: VanW family protein [Acutalibacteraceae]|uniref:VanW family protein n=1 Tax=Acutalibacteraceae TaxID=3082771 RepID=UPI0013E8C73C|nr:MULTISPECIES: VanW family protein [Acutalibacteraceae]